MDIDENLNYLLGKLSLFNQEFYQIKLGLGKTLDEMRSTYKTVREKIEKGAGGNETQDSSGKWSTLPSTSSLGLAFLCVSNNKKSKMSCKNRWND